jgi:hypothetical protein
MDLQAVPVEKIVAIRHNLKPVLKDKHLNSISGEVLYKLSNIKQINL